MTQASTFAANAAAAAQRAEAAADQAEAVVGGDFATKMEAQGYVNTHNQSTDAHTSLFSGKADLVDGKVPAAQLPDMDYIPNTEKGQPGGVAQLGDDGLVLPSQLPDGGGFTEFTGTLTERQPNTLYGLILANYGGGN